MKLSRSSPIFPVLTALSDGVLQHYTDDLYLHDREILSKMPAGSSWLWIVHKCGTHLARWDYDPQAGTRQSLTELLVRAMVRGDWSTGRCHIIHVTEQTDLGPLGHVTGTLSPDDLEDALPRPTLPAGMSREQLPKFNADEQQVFSAATGFYQLKESAK